jgi:hypothetical protein
VVLASGRTDLREGSRWLREVGPARFDEDGRLVLLGVAVLVAILSLAALTALTVHRRDAALEAGTAAAHRLGRGGQDGALYDALVQAQQHQVTLFQERVYAPGQGDPGATQAAPGPDSAADLDLEPAEDDLTVIRGQSGDSLRIQRATQIFRELITYNGLDGRAQADGQQGLPVGAAYLREASAYLSGPTLDQATNIRRADQQQITAAAARAAAVPRPLLIADALVLVGLAGAQIVTARYTRRRLNPGLVLAAVVLVVLVAWSTAALTVSAHMVGREAAPHAQAASYLARAQVYGIQAHTWDLLSLADQGEDCVTPKPGSHVRCMFETKVVHRLTSPDGRLPIALAAAGKAAPDPSTPARVITATATVRAWLADESSLFTLQNLEADATSGTLRGRARYSPHFQQAILPYTTPDLQPDGAQVSRDARRFKVVVQAAVEHEWQGYETEARAADGGLGGLVTGSVLLGLLAGAAAAAGIAWRVREYWSADRGTP